MTPTLSPRRCWFGNGYCYGDEFDAEGRRGDELVDFDGIARFVESIDTQARSRGVRVERVILAPEYATRVLESPSGRALGTVRSRFLRRSVWVRHDDHFHIDFALRWRHPATD